MNSNSDFNASRHRFSDELQNAFDTLDKYNLDQATKGSRVCQLTSFGAMKLIENLFSLVFPSEHHPSFKKEINPTDSDFKRAVELIVANSSLIKQLQNGSREEQSLARIALDAIKVYHKHLNNETSTSPHKKSLSWSRKFAEKIKDAIGWNKNLPQRANKLKESDPKELKLHHQKNVKNKPLTTIKTETLVDRIPNLTPEVRDMFNMKGIRLLKDRFPDFTSNFLKLPIQVKPEENGVVSLSKTVVLPCGEQCELKGKFKTTTVGTRTLSILLKDTFYLDSSTKKTVLPIDISEHP